MTEEKLNEARGFTSRFLTQKRNESGLTQQFIADKTAMGIATIKRFESGKFWLGQKQLVLYCEAIGIKEIPLLP